MTTCLYVFGCAHDAWRWRWQRIPCIRWKMIVSVRQPSRRQGRFKVIAMTRPRRDLRHPDGTVSDIHFVFWQLIWSRARDQINCQNTTWTSNTAPSGWRRSRLGRVMAMTVMVDERRQSSSMLLVDLVTWCCRRPSCVAGCQWGAGRRCLTVGDDRRSGLYGLRPFSLD